MEYYLIALYATALVLSLFKLYESKDNRDILMFMAFLIVSWALFNYEGYANTTDALLSGVIILNLAVSSFGSMRGNVFLVIALLYFAAALSNGVAISVLLQSVAIGAISSPRMYKRSELKEVRKPTENLRNAFQIFAGLFFIGIFLLLQTIYASVILLLVFIAGMAISNIIISSKGKYMGILTALERAGYDFGHGAFWLGVGAIFAAGFLGYTQAVVVFSAIFIADSLSTLVGVHFGKAKLPYNKRKSVVGTAAYFVVVLAISLPFMPYLSIPVALLAAFAESLPIPLDDNFFVSVVLTFVAKLLLFL